MILHTNCINHPDENAIAICQHCQSAICYRDVNKLYDPRNAQEYALCLSCYKDSMQNKLFTTSFWWIAIAGLFAFLGFLSYEQSPSGSLLMFAIAIVFVLVFVGYYKYIDINIKDATNRYEGIFVDENDSLSNDSRTTSQSNSNSHKNDNKNSPEIQQEIQKYVSWLFSNSDENKNAVKTVSPSLNQGKNTCPVCGTVYESGDAFCANCGHQRELIN